MIADVTDIQDQELRTRVRQLLSLATAEAYVRGAMLTDGPGAKKRRDALVQKGVRIVADVKRQLAAEPEHRGLLERSETSLRNALAGLSRTANLGRALESLVGARRMARAKADARGVEVGVTVPPVQVQAAESGALAAVLRQAEKIVSSPAGLDAFDRGLAQHDDT